MHKPLYTIAFSSLLALTACGGSSSPDTPPTAGQSTTQAVESLSTPETATAQANATAANVQVPPSETEAKQIADAKPVLSEIEAQGQRLYKRCVTCHTLEKDGRHKVGPNLYGVFGATAGVKEGFNFSKVMAESGVIWTDENLDAYIAKPREFMPKNRMAFVGLRKAEDRQAVLAYMRKAMEETPTEE